MFIQLFNTRIQVNVGPSISSVPTNNLIIVFAPPTCRDQLINVIHLLFELGIE